MAHPFNLTTDARGTEKQQNKPQAGEEQEAYQFKARPVPDYERLHIRETLSLAPPRRLTIGQAPTLASDLRSKKREAFNKEIKTKQEAQVVTMELEKHRSLLEENEELAQLRNSLLFSA